MKGALESWAPSNPASRLVRPSPAPGAAAFVASIALGAGGVLLRTQKPKKLKKSAAGEPVVAKTAAELAEEAAALAAARRRATVVGLRALGLASAGSALCVLFVAGAAAAVGLRSPDDLKNTVQNVILPLPPAPHRAPAAPAEGASPRP